MQKLGDYFLALRPRTFLWFVLQFGTLIFATPAILITFGLRPHRGEDWPIVAAIELAIVVVILFFSGYAVWEKERRINEDKWQGLNFEKRRTLSEMLKGSAKIPEFAIYNSAAPDCHRLGADLFHATSECWSVPIPPITHQVPLASGVVIVARPGESRAPLLQQALRKLGIRAEIDWDDRTSFNIQIGPKTL